VGDPARAGPKVNLNLTPPVEGFELYRHKDAGETRAGGWSWLYWARRNEAVDYEIRAVTGAGEAYSVPGGVFPREGFEEHYEKVEP
jgi:hypothetical protein